MYRPANGIERCQICSKTISDGLNWHLAGHLLLLRDFSTFYSYNSALALMFLLSNLGTLFIVVCCVSTIVRSK